jgi:hypothetical protein
MPIRHYLKDADAFDPLDIRAMSTALEEVCKTLKLPDDSNVRQIIAARIIDLARLGERSPARLRDRVLKEAKAAGEI